MIEFVPYANPDALRAGTVQGIHHGLIALGLSGYLILTFRVEVIADGHILNLYVICGPFAHCFGLQRHLPAAIFR